MTFGAFRLNSLSAQQAAAGIRASAATWTNQYGTASATSSGGKFNGYLSMSGGYSGSSSWKAGYITINPADPTWFLYTNKIWTVECWYKRSFTALNSSPGSVFNVGDPASGSMPQIGIGEGASYQNQLRIYVGGTSFNIGNQSYLTTWTHYAWVCHGNGTVSAYVDGERVISAASVSRTSGSNKEIGLGYAADNSQTVASHYDDVRVSNIQRYTGASYTVPSAEFANDANTLALFRFNGTMTDTTS